MLQKPWDGRVIEKAVLLNVIIRCDLSIENQELRPSFPPSRCFWSLMHALLLCQMSSGSLNLPSGLFPLLSSFIKELTFSFIKFHHPLRESLPEQTMVSLCFSAFNSDNGCGEELVTRIFYPEVELLPTFMEIHSP